MAREPISRSVTVLKRPKKCLSAFVSQYYLERTPPRELILSHAIEDQSLIESVLSELGGRRVEIKDSVRGERARYLAMAMQNAHAALSY